MNFNVKALGSGVSLVEMLVVVAITAILLVIATPVLGRWKNQTSLSHATDLLRADLKTAMSHNAKTTEGVEMAFTVVQGGTQWCYALYRGSACDCSQTEVCATGEEIFRRTHEGFPGVRLQTAVSHNRFSFRHYRRTVTAGNVQLLTEDGLQTKVVVSGYGRIRACSPSGSAHVSGYANC